MDLARDKKADDIVTHHVEDPGAPAQWICLCQGENTVHTQAISGEIVTRLKKKNVYPYSVEGEHEGRWICIDYIDVIVHVMTEETRAYYALEELWNTDRSDTAPGAP